MVLSEKKRIISDLTKKIQRIFIGVPPSFDRDLVFLNNGTIVLDDGRKVDVLIPTVVNVPLKKGGDVDIKFFGGAVKTPYGYVMRVFFTFLDDPQNPLFADFFFVPDKELSRCFKNTLDLGFFIIAFLDKDKITRQLVFPIREEVKKKLLEALEFVNRENEKLKKKDKFDPLQAKIYAETNIPMEP